MTRSPATAPLGHEFDGFLLALIGEDGSATQLSVLSALARLHVDPWEEAARLARLPREMAARKLASLLAALPVGPSGRPDPGTLAARLVALLPSPPQVQVGPRKALPSGQPTAHSQAARLVIYYLIVITSLLVSQWLAGNRHPQVQVDEALAPVSVTVSPQTLLPQAEE
jgi:hypothetical protein